MKMAWVCRCGAVAWAVFRADGPTPVYVTPDIADCGDFFEEIGPEFLKTPVGMS
ncbi:hypothetical protein ACFQFQ_07585 [Sulfitobacter porphyrae]|uniref:Uncharacterized protein n=1 Tax=Sulfitobacter porphyrae TaxID=1246864 RepID=A0ABW2B0Z7_9RHOB